MMETNEIKKALYREKPLAIRSSETKFAHYVCQLKNKSIVEFEIPHSEADGFTPIMDGKLLIRWLKTK